MRAFKWLITVLLVALVGLAAIAYTLLYISLPNIDGNIITEHVSANASVSRDKQGTAIIYSENEYDAAFLLGYAHAQDRLFQLDLLRRQSAGELSELFGAAAINIDKRHRFHQFKKRAKSTLAGLPLHEREVLQAYANGINELVNSTNGKAFEYHILGNTFRPWAPSDSLLAVYSMYLDLQRSQTEIDFSLTALDLFYNRNMYDFFTLPSNYQSAIDYSVVANNNIEIPQLTPLALDNDIASSVSYDYDSIHAPLDYGSNNWAVSGELTASKSGMMSNDMHLGLRVPTLWYKAQLNYASNNSTVQSTGVTLPGVPAIVVGSNGHIAWGFTNANVDNADWVSLLPNTATTTEQEIIKVANAEDVLFNIELSHFGPVRHLKGNRYALKWVAHQPYALNMQLVNMSKMQSLEEALVLSTKIRIPVQNMVVSDANGNVAWQLTGAIAGRTPIARKAISEDNYSPLWDHPETQPANMVNPENGRVWSANARVVGLDDLARFGDGGYALGARQQQIMTQLMQTETFTEQSFYDLQLDNRALFLTPWHTLLLKNLEESPQKYAADIAQLESWGACACPESVGYTLVRRFRSTIIHQLIAPIAETFKQQKVASGNLLRGIEPAIWRILQEQPTTWLPPSFASYDEFILQAYDKTKARLLKKYDASNNDMQNLAWGEVNKLKVKHPFSDKLGPLSAYFDMPEVAGFGDSYLPAVQSTAFGASQRFIARPGNLESAILTLPGGQSGHVLSDFYRQGFDEYTANEATPLLPSKALHTLNFTKKEVLEPNN